MFVDWDEIWRVYKGHYGVNMLLRGRMVYVVEARNMGLNTFSFSWQIKKKMFVDCDDFLGMGRGHYGVNMLLRGRMDFNGEERN